VVATQPEDDSHAASWRPGLLLRPRRSRQPRTLHTPAWPAWSLSGHARPPPPTPPGPGPPPIPRLTNARPQRQPTGTLTRCGGEGCPVASTWSPTPPPEVGGDRRDRTDGGRTPGGRTLDGWTAEGWTPDGRPAAGWTAGPRTTNPG
jgi:hypothetical protein